MTGQNSAPFTVEGPQIFINSPAADTIAYASDSVSIRWSDTGAVGSIKIEYSEDGSNWSTVELAKKIESWQFDYGQVQFLIGGPNGLSAACLGAANETWSLSRLTFPHFLVRILLAEQIYRAWSLLKKHPYHK